VCLYVCLSVLMSVVGKVLFAEVMLAALTFSGNSYYDNSWRQAAAMVTNPPLRMAPDTSDCLINRLAKYIFLFIYVFLLFHFCNKVSLYAGDLVCVNEVCEQICSGHVRANG